MLDKAYLFLNTRALSHVDMLEPLKRGTAEVLYAGTDGVILFETQSEACMIALDDLEKCKQIVNFSNYHTFVVHNPNVAGYIKENYTFAHTFNVNQASYQKNVLFEGNFENVAQLTKKDADVIFKNYKSVDDLEYITQLLNKKLLWGVYENNVLAGFMGVHPEGSMGLLEVLPQFKRKGYGYQLETFLINYFLKKGQMPFCQVVEGNEASLKLQQKIGMEISPETTTWFFN